MRLGRGGAGDSRPNGPISPAYKAQQLASKEEEYPKKSGQEGGQRDCDIRANVPKDDEVKTPSRRESSGNSGNQVGRHLCYTYLLFLQACDRSDYSAREDDVKPANWLISCPERPVWQCIAVSPSHCLTILVPYTL